MDNHYVNPRLARLYDLDSGWGADRDYYLALAAGRSSVVDLGCGTGLLCDAYAGLGLRVVGVDPAEAMLAVAHSKPHGARVRWVCSRAQDFSAEERFDLVIMTGHAFQVLHSEASVRAAFARVRELLAPGGVFVFESRNPLVDWAARWDYSLELPGGVREQRRFLSWEGPLMHFELRYQFPGEELLSSSALRFWPRAEIERLLREEGMRVRALHGDWGRGPFMDSAEEMIFTASAETGS